MTDLPAFMPDDEDLAAEDAALDAAEATAAPLVAEAHPRNVRARVAAALADLEADGTLAAPPRSSTSPRAAASSLLAWSADAVGTRPPLRFPEGSDPGDVTDRGTFGLVALARAAAPDLAARGWRVVASSLVLDGGRRSDADVAAALADLVREAARGALDGLENATERAPFTGRLGAPRFRPTAAHVERLARLERGARRAAEIADARPADAAAGALAARSWFAYMDARARLRRPHHDERPAAFARVLLETLGDLVTERSHRVVASALRGALPRAEAPVGDLDDARAWLATLDGPSVPRADVWRRYCAAGTPGGLDRAALYALASEALGAPRKTRGVVVFDVPARSAVPA